MFLSLLQILGNSVSVKRLSADYLRLSVFVIIIASFVALRLTVPHLCTRAYQVNTQAHDIIDRAVAIDRTLLEIECTSIGSSSN
jgi:hypothetical protein